MNEPLDIRYPRRERRKQRTHTRLIEAAHELFAANGYDATTLEEVAERADVHVQTLYRHFANKLALALAPDEQLLARFQHAIDDPERATDTLSFWRDWVARSAERALAQRELYLQRLNHTRREPLVAASMARLGATYEDLLTAHLAHELDVDAERNRLPRLVAIMLWGANRQAVRRWQEANGAIDLKQEAVAAVDDVIRLVEAELHLNRATVESSDAAARSTPKKRRRRRRA